MGVLRGCVEGSIGGGGVIPAVGGQKWSEDFLDVKVLGMLGLVVSLKLGKERDHDDGVW